GAEASFREALAMREKLVAKDPTNTKWRRDVYYSHMLFASLSIDLHDHAKAVPELRTALANAEDRMRANPKNESAQHAAAVIHQARGDSLVELHAPQGARTEYARALELANRHASEPHPDPAWRTLVDHVTQRIAKLR